MSNKNSSLNKKQSIFTNAYPASVAVKSRKLRILGRNLRLAKHKEKILKEIAPKKGEGK